VYWWHSQYHQCHHESQSLHRINLTQWLEPSGHPKGLGKYRPLLLRVHPPSLPTPPLLLPPLARWGGCSRGSELHPDWWWRCPPERWGGQPNRLPGWGSPAPHRAVVGDNPSWRRHGALDGCCAAKALFSCPAIISQRLESRIISNEPLENTEEESKII